MENSIICSTSIGESFKGCETPRYLFSRLWVFMFVHLAFARSSWMTTTFRNALYFGRAPHSQPLLLKLPQLSQLGFLRL